MLVSNCLMPVFSAPLCDCVQASLKPLTRRLPSDNPVAVPRFPPVMGEPKEVEIPFALAGSRPLDTLLLLLPSPLQLAICLWLCVSLRLAPVCLDTLECDYAQNCRSNPGCQLRESTLHLSPSVPATRSAAPGVESVMVYMHTRSRKTPARTKLPVSWSRLFAALYPQRSAARAQGDNESCTHCLPLVLRRRLHNI
jgi:hypothetical protein